MTTNSNIQLSAKDRHVILENVLKALQKRFYSPEKLNADWQASVEHHRSLIEGAANADAFEQAMSDLLAELHTSHLGFFHRSARRASSRDSGYRWQRLIVNIRRRVPPPKEACFVLWLKQTRSPGSVSSATAGKSRPPPPHNSSLRRMPSCSAPAYRSPD